jgi:hypothetical protein
MLPVATNAYEASDWPPPATHASVPEHHQFGNKFSLLFSGFQRTTTDELLIRTVRTIANSGG